MSSLITKSRVMAIAFVALCAVVALAAAGTVSAKGTSPSSAKANPARRIAMAGERDAALGGQRQAIFTKALKKLVPGARSTA